MKKRLVISILLVFLSYSSSYSFDFDDPSDRDPNMPPMLSGQAAKNVDRVALVAMAIMPAYISSKMLCTILKEREKHGLKHALLKNKTGTIVAVVMGLISGTMMYAALSK